MNLRSANNNDIKEVTKLIFDILEEYGLKTDPIKTDSDIQDIETNYINRNGSFDLLLDESGKIIATIGIYNIDNNICELRKMYLLKSERGKGFGKKLLDYAIEKAKSLGYKKIILETASALKEAIGLYEKYGFTLYHPEHLSGRCDQAYFLDI